jgi:hypothetical protein
MKRRDLVKRLEEIGCVLVRHGARTRLVYKLKDETITADSAAH